MNQPYDPGLQPERTKLAWQRTILSVGLGSLVYARVAASSMGMWAWALAGIGLLVAAVTGVRSRHRYNYTHRSLRAGLVELPDGLLPAVLAGSVGAAGLVILLLLLIGL